MTDDPRLPTPAPSPRGWLAVALLLLAATAGAFALDQHVSLTSQAMIYVLAVVLASYRLNRLQSVVCAVAAVTAFNYFFVPPRWTFEVEGQENLIALFTMLLVALVISHLAAGLRRETELAQLAMRRSSQLQALASQLANARSAAEAAAQGQAELDAAFAGPCVLALCGPDQALALPAATAPSDADGLHRCLHEQAVLGPGTGRWPGLNAWCLPLGDSGAACVRPALAADQAGREHAQALCALLGQALQRLRLDATMRAAQSEAQRQQLQSTYLAAISHDLRTPLAAVVGAASALQTQRDKLSRAEQDRMLASIVSEASHLSTITENTLQLVHLSNAAQALRRDWESMEEIVGAVLARVRQRDPARRVQSRLAPGLPLIRADPVLLAQLIDNLLDNALKYSQGAIELRVQLQARQLQVCVDDRGPDIPAAQHTRIFEPYTRNDQSGQRGAGLGLALCRAIAQAHGGSLVLLPRTGGGNCFCFAMPLEPGPPAEAVP